MPISDWHDLMSNTVTAENLTGRDKYGAPSYAVLASGVKARVGYEAKLLAGKDDQDILSAGYIWLAENLNVNVFTRWLIDSDPEYKTTIQVHRFFDEKGLHHVKVWFR